MPDITDQVLKEITKEFGEDLLVGAQSIIDSEPEVVSVSPSLDIGLGGGIPKGSWVTVSGAPKLGKTTTLLSFAANCQKAGMYVYYFDVEGRLKKKNLVGTRGLDYSTKSMRIIRSRPADEQKGLPAKILTAQDNLTIAEKVLMSHPGCLVIIDSFSMLLDAKEADGGIGTETRGGGAKLLAQFCRQMANVVPVQKSIVIGVLHIMANTSGMGAPKMEKSGSAVQYQLDVKLKGKFEKPWLVGEKPIGQIVTWEVVESALGPPGRVVESYIRYNVGVDDLYELFVLGEQLGLITKAGAWYTLSFVLEHPDILKDTTEKQLRAQGGEKAFQLLSSRPEWVEALRQDINRTLGVGQ
jgi:recombination protein RecA